MWNVARDGIFSGPVPACTAETKKQKRITASQGFYCCWPAAVYILRFEYLRLLLVVVCMWEKMCNQKRRDCALKRNPRTLFFFSPVKAKGGPVTIWQARHKEEQLLLSRHSHLVLCLQQKLLILMYRPSDVPREEDGKTISQAQQQRNTPSQYMIIAECCFFPSLSLSLSPRLETSRHFYTVHQMNRWHSSDPLPNF